jgi:hypothetical protein
MQARETIEVFRSDVLRVLNAESAVARAVGFLDFLEQVESDRYRLVSNRMDADLQARIIPLHEWSSMAGIDCISSASRPRVFGASAYGSKKYAVVEPSDPSAKP